MSGESGIAAASEGIATEEGAGEPDAACATAPDAERPVRGIRGRWIEAGEPPAAESLRRSGIAPELALLLARRGVESPAAAEAYLRPAVDQLHPALGLAGMEQAVARLVRARDRGERVAVVGDYDVDGVTGSALLAASFAALGIESQVILPHRMKEGYGFQPAHAERAAQSGCSLVVTVDCGTTSVEAVAAARAAGLDVIVTDHHLPGPDTDLGDAVLINPKQERCTYPDDGLSGAGLAFKLAVALFEAVDRPAPVVQLLRVACLGTIADLAPLRGENRVIAALGLDSLARTRSLGLRELMAVAAVKPPVLADDVGYRLGPRLNAAGRLGTADAALELLMTADPARARALASELDRVNQQRQDEERRVTDEAGEIFSELGGALPGILCASSPSWHRGVVGIAAGRLARRFHRPVVLLSEDEGSATATGSGRSIEGIHLHRFLDRWSTRYRSFGGHSQAIGLTIDLASLAEIREVWAESAVWDDEVLDRSIRYEVRRGGVGDLDELYRQVQQLQPFGLGNPAPVFRIGALTPLADPRIFGKGHLQSLVRDEAGARARVVFWQGEGLAPHLRGRHEILAELTWDDWVSAPALRGVDVRPLEPAP